MRGSVLSNSLIVSTLNWFYCLYWMNTWKNLIHSINQTINQVNEINLQFISKSNQNDERTNAPSEWASKWTSEYTTGFSRILRTTLVFSLPAARLSLFLIDRPTCMNLLVRYLLITHYSQTESPKRPPPLVPSKRLPWGTISSLSSNRSLLLCSSSASICSEFFA